MREKRVAERERERPELHRRAFLLLCASAPFLGKSGLAAPNPTTGGNMGVLAIVAYRPKPGKEALLLDLTRQHVPALRRLGLATGRASCAMRAADGTVIEVFEWKSKEAIGAAHGHPDVQDMWKKYEDACEYTPLARVREFNDLFASFEPLDI